MTYGAVVDFQDAFRTSATLDRLKERTPLLKCSRSPKTTQNIRDSSIMLRDENTQVRLREPIALSNNKVLGGDWRHCNQVKIRRTEAYDLEQEALTVLDEQVIYA